MIGEIDDYRAGLVKLLCSFDADLFITATPNRDVSLPSAKKTVEQFHAILDLILFGRSWKSQQRTFFIAVPERGKKGDQLHYHALVRVAPEISRSDTIQCAHRAYAKICQAGSLDVQLVGNQAARARYMVKGSDPDLLAEFVLSTEFTR